MIQDITRKYLFSPWEHAASGPHAYDCWGLVRAVYRDFLGIKIAPWGDLQQDTMHLGADKEVLNWTRIEIPVSLALVSLSRNGQVSHCGVYLEGGFILHSMQTKGVLVSSLQTLQRLGFKHADFYAHNLARITLPTAN